MTTLGSDFKEGRLSCRSLIQISGFVQKNVILHLMYTLNNIVEILQKHKPALQKKYPISRLGIFGSYARGEATENSDIDIAVDITGPMGLNFIAMADEIEGLFGIKTDVVPSRSIKPAYLAYIEKDIIYV
jgi:predicted nucleotidyltransferase